MASVSKFGRLAGTVIEKGVIFFVVVLLCIRSHRPSARHRVPVGF